MPRKLSRTFGNLPLRQKYLLSHTVAVLLTVSVLTPASYVISRNQLESRTADFAMVILQKAAFIWEAKVTEIVDYFIAQFDAVELGRVIKDSLRADPSVSRLRVERALSDIMTYKNEIRFIQIDTMDSQRFFRRRSDSTVSSEVIDALIPYDSVRDLRARPFFTVGPDHTVIMSKVLYDLDTTEYLGILTVGFDYETFSVVFPDEENRELGNVIIFDALTEGPAIFSSGAASLVEAFAPWGDRSRLQREGLLSVGDTDYIVAEIRSRDRRWILQSYTAIPDIARLSLAAARYIIIATIVTLAMAILLSAYLAGRESRRISNIKDHAQQIAAGDLSVHTRDDHMDELGQLARALEDLSARIASLVDGLASERARLAEARYRAIQSEYSALQSKINPHFIFNTLEMVNSMAKLKGDDEISEVVQGIGDLLRESVRRRHTLIPLAEEVAYIEKYLKIQQFLHEKHLSVDIQVPEELNNLSVPTFILQPIVENAVVHGIEPRRDSGRLRVEAKRDGETLILSVSDNGVGMSPEAIAKAMDEEEVDDPRHTKTGLASVDRRLRILFGEQYGVKIQSPNGEGTEVSLYFPVSTGVSEWEI